MADPTVSGIYAIVNAVNGKRYIGSAKNFAKRWSVHRSQLRAGKHHSSYLQRAWMRHGECSFEFRILRFCDPCDLVSSEQDALDALRPEYNMSPTAGSTLGVKFTSERCAKISAALAGRKRDPAQVEATASKLRGRKLPEERIAHLRGNTHSRGAQFSDERKAAMSAATRAQYESGGRSRERPPEYREKIAATLRGRKLTPEHRAAVSASMLGKKRGPYKKKAVQE